MNRRILAVAVLSLAVAGVARASWYDDYDAGIAAVRKGSWSTVIQKMSAAIKGNAKEGDKVRTYGTIMINYHPYYYRGVAYLNTGRYEDAISDFEKTSGPGAENLGTLDTLMDRAKKQLASASEPEPEPPVRTETIRPTPPVPTPTPAPVVPSIDPALRQRAVNALAGAKQKIQSAQQRRASTSPQFSQAMSIFTDATTRNAGARNNEDLSAVIAMADNAGDLADLAMPPNVPAPTPTPTPTPGPIVPKPIGATTTVMQEADYSNEVRRALEEYFAGEFEDAAKRFEALAAKMPNNGWIHAFLGASQYSVYAFEADEKYKDAALSSFRRAKRLRTWKDGLPSKYFSRRIRRAFSETAG